MDPFPRTQPTCRFRILPKAQSTEDLHHMYRYKTTSTWKWVENLNIEKGDKSLLENKTHTKKRRYQIAREDSQQNLRPEALLLGATFGFAQLHRQLKVGLLLLGALPPLLLREHALGGCLGQLLVLGGQRLLGTALRLGQRQRRRWKAVGTSRRRRQERIATAGERIEGGGAPQVGERRRRGASRHVHLVERRERILVAVVAERISFRVCAAGKLFQGAGAATVTTAGYDLCRRIVCQSETGERRKNQKKKQKP